MDDLDVGQRLLASHVRVDVQLEPADVVHVLVVDLGLLHLVVEDAVLEGLEDLVAHVDVDVELLDVGQQVHPDQLALRLLDLLQVLRLQHRDQAALVQPHHLELHLSDRLNTQVAPEGSFLHSLSASSRVVLPISEDLQVHLYRLAQLEFRLSVHKYSNMFLLITTALMGPVLNQAISILLGAQQSLPLACGKYLCKDGDD